MPLFNRASIKEKLARVIAQKEIPTPQVSDDGPDVDESSLPDLADDSPDEDIDKEDIREEVEGEIREEERLKSLEEAVESLGEKMEESLDEIGDVLKQKLTTEEDREEGLEEYKEDAEEEFQDDLTVDEFGLDSDSLVVSTNTEENAMKTGTSLRAKRQARIKARMHKKRALAAKKQAATKKRVARVTRRKASDTVGEEFNYDKDKKKKTKNTIPAPQITKVKKDEIPEMYKVADLSFKLRADKSAWDVLDVDETPVFTIEQPEAMKEEVFASEAFARKIVLDMDKLGVSATLKKYRASKVVAENLDAAKETPVADPDAPAKPVEESTIEHTIRYARALKLAFTASAKNLVNGGSNPLKAALYDKFVSVGQLDGKLVQDILESSFAESADEHATLILEQADKHMELGDATLVEYESVVGELETSDIAHAQAPVQASSQAELLKMKASKGSVPITTDTSTAIRPDAVSEMARGFKQNNLIKGYRTDVSQLRSRK